MPKRSITQHPIHLGLGASVEIEPEFSGEMDWFMQYATRHESDGAEGRLVMLSTFEQSWDSWEMHPSGSELVLCVAGEVTIHQEAPDGSKTSESIGAGEYLVNAPGVWHTADVEHPATVLFITAGQGTTHRPRA